MLQTMEILVALVQKGLFGTSTQHATTCSDDNGPHMKKMRLVEFFSEHIGLQGIGAIPEAQRLDVTRREKAHSQLIGDKL